MENLKIAICTLSIGEKYKQYTRYTTQNKKIYCEKHGYTFIEDDDVYNKDKPIPWSKLLLIQKYLSDFDYIAWIDADIYIMNKEIIRLNKKMEMQLITNMIRISIQMNDI